MPQRHTIKSFVENGHYHVYNRGVEKRDIFLDDQDYRVFLHLLKYYLSPTATQGKHPLTETANITFKRPRPLSNLGNEVKIISYCLMPNHFHLMVKQKNKDGLTKLMRRLTTTYAMYFNRRYDRVGHLFQGRYKGALITDDRYLLHLSRYIHLNPLELPGVTRTDLVNYPYSSFSYYLGKKHADWLRPNIILDFFRTDIKLPYLLKFPSYDNFVLGDESEPQDLLGTLTLE